MTAGTGVDLCVVIWWFAAGWRSRRSRRLSRVSSTTTGPTTTSVWSSSTGTSYQCTTRVQTLFATTVINGGAMTGEGNFGLSEKCRKIFVLSENFRPKCKIFGWKPPFGKNLGTKATLFAPINFIVEILQLFVPPIFLTRNAVGHER